MATTTKAKRAAPWSVRFPADLEAEIDRDARRRGVSRNDWLTEAARRRLHPAPQRAGNGCVDGNHPKEARLSQPGGKQSCRLCGTKGLAPL